MNQIGDRIAIYRQNKQMTQEEFSSRLGVTPQAVSKWERGQGLPDVNLLEGICTVLAIDANELLGIKSSKNVVENNDLAMQLEIQKKMIAEPLKIEFGSGLIQVFTDGLKTNFVNDQRKKLVEETGILMPLLRIIDNVDLQENEYQIMSYDKIRKSTIVDMTHDNIFQNAIMDVIQECKINYSDILNKQIVKSMMDNLKVMYSGEIEGVIPEKIDYLVLVDILKEIIKRNGNIRNHIKIVEMVEKEFLLNSNTNVIDITNKLMEVI